MTSRASRILRMAVLAATVVSSLTALSPTAGAVTWDNSGSTLFTATGGPGTLSAPGGLGPIVCSGSKATAAAPGGSIVGTTFSITGAATFTPCTIGISGNWYVDCVFSFTGTTQAAGQTAGSADVTCGIKVNVSPFPEACHISGATPGLYVNPSGTTAGRLTLNTASTLTVVTTTSGSCPIGSGTATLSEQTLTVTGGSPSTLGPILTRTP